MIKRVPELADGGYWTVARIVSGRAQIPAVAYWSAPGETVVEGQHYAVICAPYPVLTPDFGLSVDVLSPGQRRACRSGSE